MSSYGRFLDILAAFMGMFILPLLFLNYEAVNRIRSNSVKRTEAFLEVTANSGKISDEALATFNLSDSPSEYGCVYELNVTRNEFFPDNPLESVPVSFSFPEILNILKDTHEIRLRPGDYVSVSVFAIGMFGRKTYLLTSIGKTI